MKVTWVQYQQYSGCKISGTVPVPKPSNKLHMERAYYLTAMIEAPTYGAINSYDGTGMSGGPLHNIAVYPSDLEQGSLFYLLRKIKETVTSVPAIIALEKAYYEQKWYLASDGKLRTLGSATLVKGKNIRDIFTPPEGRVPKTGPLWETAKKWAILHYNVLSAPATFETQKNFAIDWLIATQKETEDLFYQGRDVKKLSIDNLPLEEDLALCVYHCYSVNAPAPAKTELLDALKRSQRGAQFAKVLIAELAKNTFGNWENRYVRTRNEALKSGLWPSEFFNGPKAIFPAERLTV